MYKRYIIFILLIVVVSALGTAALMLQRKEVPTDNSSTVSQEKGEIADTIAGGSQQSRKTQGENELIPQSRIRKTPAAKKDDVLPHSYLDLKASAQNGDSAAAYLLATKLRFCSEISSKLDLVARHLEEGTIDESDEGYRKVINDWKYCSEIPGSDYNSRYDWLREAAQRGDERALVDYVRYGSPIVEHPELAYKDPVAVEQYKTDSIRFLNTAANRGSIEAMVDLSGAYSDGYLVDKNNVLAYAYSYAASGTGEGSIHIRRVLEMQRDKLSAEEEVRGKEIGEKILEKCCR